MDILYTVGNVSEHDDQELRWSLRSIAKYGMNVDRVIVTSPVARDWLSDEVIQCDVQDLPHAGYKHHNIMRAIIETIKLLNLRGEFLVSSDDHFYTKRTDFDDYPFQVRGWCVPQHSKSKIVGSLTAIYRASCRDGGKFLQEHDLPTVNFQGHMNSHWHGGIVMDHIKLFEEAMKLRFCVEPHVLMGNIWLSVDPTLRMKYRVDRKLHKLEEADLSCDSISIHDDAFKDPAFMSFMNEEFGAKCMYER